MHIQGEYPIGDGFIHRLVGPLVVFGVISNLTLSACMAINRMVMFKSRALYEHLFSPTRTRIACTACLLCGAVWAVSTSFDWCRSVFDLRLKKWLYQVLHSAQSAALLKYCSLSTDWKFQLSTLLLLTE